MANQAEADFYVLLSGCYQGGRTRLGLGLYIPRLETGDWAKRKEENRNRKSGYGSNCTFHGQGPIYIYTHVYIYIYTYIYIEIDR